MIIIEKDKVLWRILAIIGINLSNYRLRTHEMLLSYFILLSYSFLALHWMSASTFYMYNRNILGGLSYFLVAAVPVVIWLLLNKKKKRISCIVEKLYIYRKQYMKEDNRPYMINNFIIIMISSIVLIPSCLLVLLPDTKLKTDFWLFKYEIKDNILHKIFIFYCYFFLYAHCIMNLFVIFSLCTLFYRWGEVLCSYRKLLKFHLRGETQNKTTEILKDFFNIINILRKLDQIISYPSFLIIFYALGMFFISLYAIALNKKDFMSSTASLVEFTFTASSGLIIIFMYSLSSSMIPEKIVEIKNTARKYINKHEDNNFQLQSVIFYLRRIETEENVYISACGLFYINRQFILTAIGVTLTYDLLILNLY